MKWNWQLAQWPKFVYDINKIALKERDFFIQAGSSFAFLKSIQKEQKIQVIIDMLTIEGVKNAKIEGEILEKESLQSSIRKHFGLTFNAKYLGKKEQGMAELLCDVYDTFKEPLTHEMLWQWHTLLFAKSENLSDKGRYRTHSDPMQIVSGRLDFSKVFFEAPPSKQVFEEMTKFIEWFNAKSDEPILGKASLAHVYFESIHPFEDGNGRIGRVLVEKMLSQAMEQPVLMAISQSIEKQKKSYYLELEKCNTSLDATSWVEFFSETIIKAQKDSLLLLRFIIEKSKMMHALSNNLNIRQEKALLRMFAEGVEGFKGGLSADNYIAITKTSKATATRDLADLVGKKALIKKGELKHTRYFLNIEKD